LKRSKNEQEDRTSPARTAVLLLPAQQKRRRKQKDFQKILAPLIRSLFSGVLLAIPSLDDAVASFSPLGRDFCEEKSEIQIVD
jgi:hypothetical protein